MPRKVKYSIKLSPEDRAKVLNKLKDKDLSKTLIKHCHILLDLDESHPNPSTHSQVSATYGVSTTTISILCHNFCEKGLDYVLAPHRSYGQQHSTQKVDANIENVLAEIACMDSPDGHNHWSLQLITDEFNNRKAVLKDGEPVTLSKETVRRTLKKNELKPWKNKYYCIPAVGSGDFVWRMEDVLNIYSLPRNPKRPVVCVDEKPLQILSDVKDPIPMKPGRVKILDDNYKREGVADIFTVVAPLEGDHYADVQKSRTRKDFARVLKHISDEMYPESEKIILVMDNLNTHTMGSLYELYSPDEAFRIAERFEIHYTPKHGSWLDMAEIEINAMTRECLNRRFESIEEVQSQVAAWEKERNVKKVTFNWTFTTEIAREKLKRIYPDIDEAQNLPALQYQFSPILGA